MGLSAFCVVAMSSHGRLLFNIRPMTLNVSLYKSITVVALAITLLEVNVVLAAPSNTAANISLLIWNLAGNGLLDYFAADCWLESVATFPFVGEDGWLDEGSHVDTKTLIVGSHWLE